MSKEHIFQISMSFDEDMALNAARDQAAGMIFGKVQSAVKSKYGSSRYGTNEWQAFAKELVCEAIDGILKESKNDIIQLAADKLAERVAKTKAWKEKVVG